MEYTKDTSFNSNFNEEEASEALTEPFSYNQNPEAHSMQYNEQGSESSPTKQVNTFANLEYSERQESPTCIKVVGVGGAGMNAVNRMKEAGLEGVEFIAINTDEQVLARSIADQSIAIGQKTTRGMGAGGNPSVGQKAALEDQDRLSQLLRASDLVFITAGMGGGTGTGAAPIVAEVAREQGALVIGVVTLPFLHMEGMRRMSMAEKGIDNLRSKVDSLITIRNDSIFKVTEPDVSVDTAFRLVDDILLNAVRGISDLINTTGLINVDFADVRSIMGETGDAIIGAGEGIGGDRVEQAVSQSINNALLEEKGIEGATAALINICANEEVSLTQIKDVTERITSHIDPQANIIMGLTTDPSLGDRLRVTVISTGFKNRTVSKLGASNMQQNLSQDWRSRLHTNFSDPNLKGGSSRPSIAPTPNPHSELSNMDAMPSFIRQEGAGVDDDKGAVSYSKDTDAYSQSRYSQSPSLAPSPSYATKLNPGRSDATEFASESRLGQHLGAPHPLSQSRQSNLNHRRIYGKMQGNEPMDLNDLEIPTYLRRQEQD